MEKIEAHEVQVLIQATTYPHQSKKDKTKTMNRLRRIGQIEEKQLDSIDIAKMLGIA